MFVQYLFVLSQIKFPLEYRHLSWAQLSCTACAIKAHKENNILHCLLESNQKYSAPCWHVFNFMVLRKNYRSVKQQTLPYCSTNSIAYHDIYGTEISPSNWQKHHETTFLSSATNPCRENVNVKSPLKTNGSPHSDQLHRYAEEQD